MYNAESRNDMVITILAVRNLLPLNVSYSDARGLVEEVPPPNRPRRAFAFSFLTGGRYDDGWITDETITGTWLPSPSSSHAFKNVLLEDSVTVKVRDAWYLCGCAPPSYLQCCEECCYGATAMNTNLLGTAVVPAFKSGWFQLVLPQNVSTGEILVKTEKAWRKRDPTGYCEDVRRAGAVAQPANAWSSFVFVVTGMYMLIESFELKEFDSAFARTYAASHAFAGSSSFLFHASFSPVAQRMDMSSVYTLLLIPACYAVCNTAKVGTAPYLTGALACFAIPVALEPSIAASGAVQVVSGLLAGMVISEGVFVSSTRESISFDPRLAALAAALGGTSYALRQADNSACRPNSAFQMHAAWHACSAVALWLNYRFLVARTARCVESTPVGHVI